MIRMVIPDSGPLISFGKIDRMDLIDRFKCPIIITDVVQMEVTDGPDDATDARVLSDWMERGGNRLHVAETTFGQLLKQNRQLLDMVPEDRRAPIARQFKWKNAGELSILEFATEIRTSMSDNDTTLVLFEDNGVRSIPFGDHVHMLSNWSFAKSLETMGVIPSADGLFDQIEAAGRNVPRRPFEREPEGSQGALTQVYDTVETFRNPHARYHSSPASRHSLDGGVVQAKTPERRQGRREDMELQLACALTERTAPSGDDDQFHRKLGKTVRDALAAASKTEGVSQEAADELAAKIARARAETDLRVELTREFSDSTLHEFRARFEGHPRFSRGDMLDPYDAAIKERIATLDRTPPVPDDLERIVARAAVATAGTGNEGTARKMVQALKCGTVPDAEEIRTRQKALLADLAQPEEIEADADKDRLAQEVYRCFTLEETRQICEGRGPFIQTLASDADRSRVAAGFRTLHDFEIVGPAPWAGLHRTMQSTLAERNAPGERLAGRSDPAQASRFPKHET